MKITLGLAFLAISGLSILSAYGQEKRFYMPSEIKQAYDNGTRSFDGKPGPDYWQNMVDYQIQVKIDPESKMISGEEEVVYHNSSPNELNTLIVRLYMDAYKKGNSRSSIINPKDIDDGVELTGVKINGIEFDLSNRDKVRQSGTNITFTLDKPLKSGESLTFNVFWKQKIPVHTRIRTGAYDSTSFFVAYWYPQIAVYDDLFGWDRLNYTLRTEFYNNLGNYDVEITVPDNFLVWATGNFNNASEVLPAPIHERFTRAKSSQDVVHIVTSEDIRNGFRSLTNTWHYTASEVSDFAFAMSDHYVWDAVVQPIGNRNIFISSAYSMEMDTVASYTGHTAIQQKAMKHFSEDMPGVPYPYEAFTTFIAKGGGGMEYPMMANNGGPGRGVTIHEMFHMYFPMYVRVNERRWAWMDEGWAQYMTALVTNRYFEDDHELAKVFARINPGATMGTIADLPLITSSQFLTGSNYGYASYSLPATIYAIIHQHLGEALFKTCYQEYIRRWAKKSPTPYDFFYTFENVSGQDLSWIWKPWFFEFGVADVAIQSYEKGKLVVNNIGNKPVPIFVEIIYNNDSSKRISKSAEIWKDGNKIVEIAIPDYENMKKISINNGVADVNIINNFYPSVRSLYKNVDLSADIMGRYQPEQFPVKINIIEDDGLIYIKIPEFRIDRVIYPKDKENFVSLDGSVNLKFDVDESGKCSGVEIIFIGGFVVNAEKLGVDQ